MNAVAIINLAGVLVGTLGPVAIDMALKIKGLIEQANLGTVDVKAVGEAAVKADDDTMKLVNDWLTAQSMKPLPPV